MGLAVVLGYIALYLLSPADMFPALIPFRPTLILALFSLPLAGLARLQNPWINKLRVQFVLLCLFFGWALCSMLPHGRVGRNLTTLLDLSPNVIVYFVGVCLLGSPARLSWLRTTLVLVAMFILINGRHLPEDAVAHGAPLPVGDDLLRLYAPRLIAHHVGDLFARVQDFQVLHAVAAELRIRRRALGRGSAFAHNQLFVADVDRLALHQVGKRQRAAHRDGERRVRGAIELGQQPGALQGEPRLGFQAASA